MLIDTHCHLNFPDAFPDPGAEVAAAAEAGVEALFVVGVDRASSERAVELAARFHSVYAVVGWQPNYAKSFRGDEDLSLLEGWLGQRRVVAIGEIGLDYYWDHATPAEQALCLEAQLELASRLDSPVVFHCREAYSDLLTALERRGAGAYLIHCFSGDAEDAARGLALGAMFGVDGPITYKSSGPLRERMQEIGLGRIVLETDSPYLTPAPHRGKPNRPAYVRFVCHGLAAALGVSEEECAAGTSANARAFFRI